jgi:hypothetical protein
MLAQTAPSATQALATARVSPSNGDLQQIVTSLERVQATNPARTEPYVLVRQYRFFQGEDATRAKSEVVAEVTFTPPNVKTFDILESHGNGRGASVVKHILENEAELAKDVSKNELSRKNYVFSLAGETVLEGKRCYVLAIAPRREDRSLLRGRIYIDANSFHVLRTEGEPARSPSWWLRSSYVVLRYGEAEGLWLPIATEGSGEVRLFGHFALNSQKLEVRIGADAVAQNRATNQHRIAIGAAAVPRE